VGWWVIGFVDEVDHHLNAVKVISIQFLWFESQAESWVTRPKIFRKYSNSSEKKIPPYIWVCLIVSL